MTRARLRIVTIRDEDILNNEPPDSNAVPVASATSDSAKKVAAKKDSAEKGPVKKTAAKAPKARPSKPGPSKPEPLEVQSTAEAKTPATKATKTNGGPSAKAPKTSDAKTAPSPKARAAKPLSVASFMQAKVVTCSLGEALSSVGQAMWDNNVGLVVVLDEQRRPISVVSDRDLAMAAYTQGIALGHIGVGICMSKRLVTCAIDADATQVAALMQEHQVRRIPVVDADGQLAGIVGLSDLLKAASQSNGAFKPTDVLAALTGVLS